MAVYEVTSPDGAVYEIEGPEGADPSQILAQISRPSQMTAEQAAMSQASPAFASQLQSAQPSDPSLLMAPVGGAEMLLKYGTGALASVPAALAYGGAAVGRAFGADVDPSAVMGDVLESLTYQPLSDSAQAGEQALTNITRPVIEPVVGAADQFAARVGQTSPVAETFLREAPAALGAAGALVPGAAAIRGASRAAVPGPAPPANVAPPAPSTNPFARESMGAAAAAPNVSSLTPELRSAIEQVAQSGRPINREVLTRHVEADQLPIPMRLSRGQATQDPVQLSVEQNTRAKNQDFAKLFNEQNQLLIDNLDEVRAQVSPSVVGQDHIQNGQALIDLYKTLDEPRREAINTAYRALNDASGGHFPLNSMAFANNTQKALKAARKSRFLPSALESELKDFAGGARMSFRDFEEMRTILAAEARKAERAGDGNAKAAINIMRENLEAIPMVAGTQEIKALADRARTLARERFKLIEDDPAYAAVVDDGVEAGAASPLADTFVDKYIVRGKAAHLDRMKSNLAPDPLGQELMAAGALNYLKKKAGIDLYNNTGNFSQAGFNRALSNDVLPRAKQLLPPQIAETLERLGNVARYTQAQPRGSFVNNSNTFTAAMGEHVGNVLEGVANVQAGGLPVGTYVRNRLQGRSEKKFVRESVKPGAGIE